jgi:glycosyltransferase involved in cell wall biosynthesis
MLEILRSRGIEVEATLLAPPSIRALDTFGCRILQGLTDEEVVHEFRETDLVVSTVVPEGFGYPPLEAMAVGRPAVLVDSGGSREYHAHEENALVLPTRDPSALADAVGRLVHEPALVRRLIEGGLRTASEFRWPAMQERFQAALRDIMEGARTPANPLPGVGAAPTP